MTATDQAAIPERLGKLQIEEFTSNPYEALARFRAEAPAVPIESAGSRFWVITRHDDVRRALTAPGVVRDLVTHRHEINSHCVVGNDDKRARVPHGARRSVFYQDGENHHKIRALAATYFAPNKLENLTRATERIGRDVLATLRPGQSVDLIADYARPIASKVFCEVAGIPANDRNLQAVLKTESIMSSDRDRIERSAQELVTWAKELVEIKRRQSTADLYTSLLKFHEEMGLTEDELTSTYVFFAVGSMEPVNTIGNGAFLFLTYPDQLAEALAQPDLFSACVDEIVRYETAFRFVAPRYTTVPLELDGMTIPAGELLLVSLGSANRDPDFVADPDVFDITRTPTGHLGFGHGVYRCLGAQLGKIQTAVALRNFFERFPSTTISAPSSSPRWRPGKFLRRLESLYVIPS